jgi:AraC-like DNA-binding protein
MDLAWSIQKAIDYIESNILNDINYDDIAKQMYSSSFHFHRAFSMLTGMAKGFVNKTGDDWHHVDRLTDEAINQQTKYIATLEFHAEIYVNPNVDQSSLYGHYVSCKEKE